MGRQTIEGFAVVRKQFGKRTFEVMGIGQDTPLAWSDAASRVYSLEWVDAKEMIARHPEMKTVKAMVTVSFENPEVAG